MNWLLARLREPSTIRGLVWLATVAGLSLRRGLGDDAVIEAVDAWRAAGIITMNRSNEILVPM